MLNAYADCANDCQCWENKGNEAADLETYEKFMNEYKNCEEQKWKSITSKKRAEDADSAMPAEEECEGWWDCNAWGDCWYVEPDC